MRVKQYRGMLIKLISGEVLLNYSFDSWYGYTVRNAINSQGMQLTDKPSAQNIPPSPLAYKTKKMKLVVWTVGLRKSTNTFANV